MPQKKTGPGKPAAKKTAAKKAAGKARLTKAAADGTARKPLRGGIAQLVKPGAALVPVVGDKPLTRAELTRKIWAYIKANKLQDATDRRSINADGKLKPVFDGKARVTMFEMTRLVNRHLS